VKTLLTGATGFVGGALLEKLKFNDVRVLGRSRPELAEVDFVAAEIKSNVDYSSALVDVGVIVHSAARAHIMNDNAQNPLEAFRDVNALGTLNLARQAAESGVKRFIFISSIKVNGEGTQLNEPYSCNDQTLPEDAYGKSKVEAELGLRKIAQETGMEAVIIRPPLVYGPGVKANFAAIMKLASKNLPLPLGAIHNKRSLVALDNLVDLIVTCIDHPKAANETFLVSDDQDVSTTELLNKMTLAAGKKPWLIPVPMKLIQLAATILGKKTVADRLCGNLQVDISHTKEVLGWTPPITLEQGLARCFHKKVN
jgi:nucleoside-diphosphate-sugar epimerase